MDVGHKLLPGCSRWVGQALVARRVSGEVLLHVVFLTPLLASPALGIVRDACLGRGGTRVSGLSSYPVETSGRISVLV